MIWVCTYINLTLQYCRRNNFTYSLNRNTFTFVLYIPNFCNNWKVMIGMQSSKALYACYSPFVYFIFTSALATKIWMYYVATQIVNLCCSLSLYSSTINLMIAGILTCNRVLWSNSHIMQLPIWARHCLFLCFRKHLLHRTTYSIFLMHSCIL